jgi:ABC-2 type transport system ATP-binding protein
MAEPIIEIRALVKEFRGDFWRRKVRILDGVDLTVERGDIFAFLGPNGSGKTTTIKILMGLIFPTAGELRLFGEDYRSTGLKSRIGFLPENPYFYEYLDAVEFLSFYADLFQLSRAEKRKRIDYLLELVGIKEHARLQLRKFSKGMLQRIGIAQALINDPELVILDEPQTGLDPLGRRDVREILLALKGQGKTIFFSSHIMPDVEAICEKIGIIIGGRIRDVGRLDQLLQPRMLYYEVIYQAPQVLPSHVKQTSTRQIGNEVVTRVADDAELSRVIKEIYANSGKVISVTPHKETLEDHFVEQVRTR